MTFKISSACLMSASLLLVALAVMANAEKSSIAAVEKDGTLNNIQGAKAVHSKTDVKTANLKEVVNSNLGMEIEDMFDEEMDDDVEHDEEDEDVDEDEYEEDEDVDSEFEIADREADIDDDDDEEMDEDEEEHEEHEVEAEGDLERSTVDTDAGITGASGATTDVEGSIKIEMGTKKGVNGQNK